MNYTKNQLDGLRAYITRAARMAIERGIIGGLQVPVTKATTPGNWLHHRPMLSGVLAVGSVTAGGSTQSLSARLAQPKITGLNQM
jgi:hypothetical protein